MQTKLFIESAIMPTKLMISGILIANLVAIAAVLIASKLEGHFGWTETTVFATSVVSTFLIICLGFGVLSAIKDDLTAVVRMRAVMNKVIESYGQEGADKVLTSKANGVKLLLDELNRVNQMVITEITEPDIEASNERKKMQMAYDTALNDFNRTYSILKKSSIAVKANLNAYL